MLIPHLYRLFSAISFSSDGLEHPMITLQTYVCVFVCVCADQVKKSHAELEPKVTSLPTFVPLVAVNHTLCPSRSRKCFTASVAGNPSMPEPEEHKADASWSVTRERFSNSASTLRIDEDYREMLPTWWLTSFNRFDPRVSERSLCRVSAIPPWPAHL